MYLGEEWLNLTYFLLNNDYEDVWLIDWRGSNVYQDQYKSLNHNVEQASQYDIPMAIEFIIAKSSNPLHVIAHCVGSIAFFLWAAVRGDVNGVEKKYFLAKMFLYSST